MLVVPLAVAGTKEKVLEELLHGVVLASVLAGLYPRTAIQVIVQVVHDDGSVRARACARRQAQKPTCPRSLIVSSSVPPLNQRQLLAAAINGAMLALLDAGISMRATVTAATAAFLPGSPDLLLDPTAEETAVRAVSTPRGPPSLAHTHPMPPPPSNFPPPVRTPQQQAAESVHTFAVANGGEGDAIVSDSVGLFTVAQVRTMRVGPTPL